MRVFGINFKYSQVANSPVRCKYSTKPLDNILVVSLEQAVAAPYCSVRLRDAGARVIKIERQEGNKSKVID